MTSMYQPDCLPSTQQIRDTFADEIASLGGIVSDVFDDDLRVFARALLSADADVRPGDTIKSGIAVRANSSEIVVHPYIFRLVCTNGAIVAQALQSRRFERIQSTDVIPPTYEVAVTLNEVRNAVRSCAAPEVFTAATSEMRSAADVEADWALQMIPALARLGGDMAMRVLPQILERFGRDGDRSAFGLMNAVTSVARDAQDPETRWNLEALGGTIPARLVQPPRTAPTVSAVTVAK